MSRVSAVGERRRSAEAARWVSRECFSRCSFSASLCTAIVEIVRELRRNLYGKTNQLFSVRLPRGQQSCQDAAALWGDLPAIGA